jgi:hypothetical protein
VTVGSNTTQLDIVILTETKPGETDMPARENTLLHIWPTTKRCAECFPTGNAESTCFAEFNLSLFNHIRIILSHILSVLAEMLKYWI